MRRLLSAEDSGTSTPPGETKEGFANLFSSSTTNLDLIVLILIGVFLIFVLDSLARIRR